MSVSESDKTLFLIFISSRWPRKQWPNPGQTSLSFREFNLPKEEEGDWRSEWAPTASPSLQEQSRWAAPALGAEAGDGAAPTCLAPAAFSDPLQRVDTLILGLSPSSLLLIMKQSGTHMHCPPGTRVSLLTELPAPLRPRKMLSLSCSNNMNRTLYSFCLKLYHKHFCMLPGNLHNSILIVASNLATQLSTDTMIEITVTNPWYITVFISDLFF